MKKLLRSASLLIGFPLLLISTGCNPPQQESSNRPAKQDSKTESKNPYIQAMDKAKTVDQAVADRVKEDDKEINKASNK